MYSTMQKSVFQSFDFQSSNKLLCASVYVCVLKLKCQITELCPPVHPATKILMFGNRIHNAGQVFSKRQQHNTAVYYLGSVESVL